MAAIPAQIGKYRITRLLGSGGMGRVYLGTDPDIGREVAIKVIHLDRNAGDGGRERFLREARTMGRLSHPNIVTLLEYGVEDDTPYLVLEFLQGEDLGEWLLRRHSLVSYLRLMRDLAAAIAAAHHAGVLHRDIKPDNIRVMAEERCKLLDFGIADGAEDSRLTGTGAFVGTTEFVAPEVISGQRHSEQSDIYALGLLYYQMLAGFNPFRADNVATTLARILQMTPVPLSAVRDGIPTALNGLVAACLEKDPGLRPTHADRLIEVLDQCLLGQDASVVLGPVKAAATVTATAFVMPGITAGSRRLASEQKRRQRWRTAATLVVGGLLAAAWLLRTPVPVPADAETRPPGPAAGSSEPAPARSSAVPDAPASPATQASVEIERDRQGTQDERPGPGEAVSGAARKPESTAPKPASALAAKPAAPPAAVDATQFQRTPSRSSPGVSESATAAAAAKEPAVHRPLAPASVASADTAALDRPSAGVADPTPALRPPLLRPLPPTAAAAPSITGSSSHFLVRGRPVRLQLSGAHFSGVTSARILLGLKTDSRFQISAIEIDNDAALSLRIEAARNLPLGHYGLVLESANGASAPYSLEISL